MFEFIHTPYMEKLADHSEQVEPYMARVITEIDKSISDRVSISMDSTFDQIGREQPSTAITVKKTANVGPSVGFYNNEALYWPRKTLLASAINIELSRGKHVK